MNQGCAMWTRESLADTEACTAGRNQVEARGMAEAAAMSMINLGSHGERVKSQSNHTRVTILPSDLVTCSVYQNPLAAWRAEFCRASSRDNSMYLLAGWYLKMQEMVKRNLETSNEARVVLGTP